MGAEFWVASLVLVATPGTGALFSIAAGLAHGARAGLTAAVGCTLALIPHLLLALTGAAAVLAASALAFEAIRWAGVAYLVLLAWGTWRNTGVLSLDPEGVPPSALRVIGSAVLLNLLNPKLALFFLLFFPMFVDPRTPGAVSTMAWMGAAFAGITLGVYAVYGVCAAWVRRYVVGTPGSCAGSVGSSP